MAVLSLALVAVSKGARADLPEWVRFIGKDSPLREVFFRPVALPLGAELSRRPPEETRAGLSKLIEGLPEEGDLYALRAREAERSLDFADAEADWKTYATLAEDPAEGQLALADFYHRRALPEQEVKALLAAARFPGDETERFLPLRAQRSWKAFERILDVVETHALPPALAVAPYHAWLERYPAEKSLYSRFFDFLVEHSRFSEAEQVLGNYEQRFPEDRVFVAKARVSLTRRSESDEAGLAFLEEHFDPLWPAPLVEDYLALVKEVRSLLDFLGRAREAFEQDPEDLKAAARIFYYYRHEGNPASAQAALADFRRRKEVRGSDWKAEELLTLAKLFGSVQNPPAAACHYYQLYSLPTATEAQRETAIAELIELLADAQPFQAGSGVHPSGCDLSAVEGDATLRNEILLLLIPPEPRTESQSAARDFRPAELARLFALFDERFPQSELRAALRVRVLEAYAGNGDNDDVLRGGKQFLTNFDDLALRVKVLLLMAGAYAAQNQVDDEAAVYDSLLRDLAAEADGAPLGLGVINGGGHPAAAARLPGEARSPAYQRVLDRYVSRLLALQRGEEAVTLYAREIDRNRSDPGLYDRLAAFLRAHGLGAQLEQVYRRAIQQFSGPFWRHKLARWCLERQNHAEFERLTREAVNSFAGAELAEYFDEVADQGDLDPAVYLQINLLAHERFPFDLTYVLNLVRAYEHERTRDETARERLLRRYWFYDDELRTRFIALLSATRKLEPEREQLRSSLFAADAGNWQQLVRENPAAAQFLAETEIRRSRFEPVAPLMLALVNDFPIDEPLVRRAVSVCYTLALANPLYVHVVAGIEEGLQQANPRDRKQLARLGEIWAELQDFDRAETCWERMAGVEPGNPEAYLEAATALTTYGLFEAALRVLETGREHLAGNPEMFAFEEGGIHEKMGDGSAAIAQYLQSALATAGDSPARERLVELSKLPAHRELIERATVQLTAGRNPTPPAIDLRTAILEGQGRGDELAQFLLQLVANTDSLDLLTAVNSIAVEQGVEAIRTRVVERQIELTDDPVERARLQLLLLRLLRERQDIAAMERVRDDFYAEHPAVADVVRGRADSSWQDKDFDRAVDMLFQEARNSYSQLGSHATLEAARGATEVGGFARARVLLQTLLAEDPFSAEYLSAMANTYIRESRYQPLRDFYRQKIDELESAPLPAAEKSEPALALHRGMISTLTALGEHASALDHYIEIINIRPEDQELIAEAARYADVYGRREQLIDFYTQSTSSPGDRNRMVLAQLQAQFEDFSGPEPSYGPPPEGRLQRLAGLEPQAPLENLFEEVRSSYQPRVYQPRVIEPPRPAERPRPIEPPRPVEQARVTEPVRAVESLTPPPVTSGVRVDHGVPSAEPDSLTHFFVQTGAFKRDANAARLLGQLQEKGFPAERACGDDFDRVLVGPYDTRPQAVGTQGRLSVEGYETWVRRLAYREKVQEYDFPSAISGPDQSGDAPRLVRCIDAMSYKPLGSP